MTYYQISSQAKEDLIQIRRFTLKQWGYQQSLYYLEQLRQTFNLISIMPLSGRPCSNDLGINTYRFLSGSHAIYYHYKEKIVTIVAILHQNMTPEEHLTNRLESDLVL